MRDWGAGAPYPWHGFRLRLPIGGHGLPEERAGRRPPPNQQPASSIQHPRPYSSRYGRARLAQGLSGYTAASFS